MNAVELIRIWSAWHRLREGQDFLVESIIEEFGIDCGDVVGMLEDSAQGMLDQLGVESDEVVRMDFNNDLLMVANDSLDWLSNVTRLKSVISDDAR